MCKVYSSKDIKYAESYNLTQRCIHREPAALDELLQKVQPIIHSRYIRKIPKEDVPDLIQDIYVAMLECLERYRGDSEFNTYFIRVVLNSVANYFRRRGRITWVALPNDYTFLRMHDPWPETEEDILLDQLMVNASEQQKETVSEWRSSGDLHAAADILNISFEAARSQVRRVAARLRLHIVE